MIEECNANVQTTTIDTMKRIRKHLDKFQNIQEISENENILLLCAYKIVGKISEDLKDKDILKNKKGRKKQQFSEVKSQIGQIL